MSLLRGVCVMIFALLPVVTARRSGGGGGSVSSGGSSLDDTKFIAPPLEIANLVVFGILLLATLIQLAIAIPAMSRHGARLPAVGAVVTLVCLTIGYALGVATIVATYTYDDGGIRRISPFSLIHIEVVGSMFYKWADPAMLAAVALVLRNRYRTLKAPKGALIGFTVCTCVLLLTIVALVAAEAGIADATNVARRRREISLDDAAAAFTTASNIYYAYIALYVVATIFLAVTAFLVRVRMARKDKIISLTLFVIIPILLLHALARLVLTVVSARLPLSNSFTLMTLEALDLSSTIVFGFPHFAAMAVLLYLLGRSHLWDVQAPTIHDAPPIQGTPFFVQGMPPVQGTTPPQFPPAQFPGQWGYPQQLPQSHAPPPGPNPQQPQYGYQQPQYGYQQPQYGYQQPQQYAYVPIYPQMQVQDPVNEEKPQVQSTPPPPVQ